MPCCAVLHQVSDMRISYEMGGLEEADFEGRDPLAVFDQWFKEAVERKVRAALRWDACCAQ